MAHTKQITRPVEGIVDFHLNWKTTKFPCDLKEEPVAEEEEALSAENGSVCRTVDFGPDTISPNHRTPSLDYGIMVAGTIVLVLDDKKEIELKAGDVVVQRGTIHAWHNRSTEWARMTFVLLDAHKPVINGETLEPCYIH